MDVKLMMMMMMSNITKCDIFVCIQVFASNCSLLLLGKMRLD